MRQLRGIFFTKNNSIIPMSSNKRLPWKFNCGFAGSSSWWNGKQRKNICQNLNYYKNRRKRTRWRITHIRHLFVTNFLYDGNSRHHLEARNNQLAMRNLPTWYAFPVQSSTIHAVNLAGQTRFLGKKLQTNVWKIRKNELSVF